MAGTKWDPMQFEPLPRCPKCNHLRSPDATNPAWQCPACGVAYNKVDPDIAFRAKMARREQAALARTQSIRRKSTFRFVSNRGGHSSTSINIVGFVTMMVVFYSFLGLEGSRIVKEHFVLKWLAPLAVLFFFWHWFEAYRRLRIVADVPTTKIAAAAQGYVEISGCVEQLAAFPLDAALTRAPCVWYYSIRSSKASKIIAGVPFMLRDSTGACMVEMEKAEVVCDRKWGESIGAEEWSIRVGDTVHVIGHFISGTREAQSQINYAVTHELATQMQRDPAAYVERFDVNQDGKVDALEHDRARNLLVQEKTRAKVINQGGVHRIGPSPDGRPFVVIGADHDRFVIHYRRLALFHLLAFIGALGASAFFWMHPNF